MQNLKFRQGLPDDLDVLIELERRCFSESEAADRITFELRMKSFSRCFWVLEDDGQIVCMINGMTTNHKDLCDTMYENTDLYSPDGDWLMIFGVATLPSNQKSGYASKLMYHVIEETKQQGRQGIVLTCKKNLIPFYCRFGFISEGISDSVHGGAEWYQMRLSF